MPSPNRIVLNISIDRELVDELDKWRQAPARAKYGFSRSRAASILLERGMRKPTRQKGSNHDET